MKLKRIQAGEYRTLDGRYKISFDPHSYGGHDSYRNGGVTWWIVDTTGEIDWSECSYPTLGAARADLERYLLTEVQ